MLKRFFIILFAAVLATGCIKVPNTTDIYLSVKIQPQKSDQPIETDRFVSYLFAADTLYYSFASYDQALRGEITLDADGSVEEYLLAGDVSLEGSVAVFPEVFPDTYVIVVCDTENKTYYYRNAQTGVGLEQLLLYLTMRPWKFVQQEVVIEKPWIGKK